MKTQKTTTCGFKKAHLKGVDVENNRIENYNNQSDLAILRKKQNALSEIKNIWKKKTNLPPRKVLQF